jgi:hypothetical protein
MFGSEPYKKFIAGLGHGD